MSAELISFLALALHVVVVLAASVWISLHRKPTTAIAWILTIIFLPLLGLVAFMLIGFGRLPKARRSKQKEVNDLAMQRAHILEYNAPVGHSTLIIQAAQLNRNLGALPMMAGNSGTIITDYEQVFARLCSDIDAARHSVHIEFYILVKDHTTTPLFESLKRAVERGVKVRVLFDHVSSLMFPGRKETQQYLDRIGAQWAAMLPLRPHRLQWQRPDMRNHRKIVVIDDNIGYTGSQNLIDSSYLKPKNQRLGLHWKEVMVRFEGPIVAELQAVFITDWYSEKDELLEVAEIPYSDATSGTFFAQVIPSGPSFENDNNLKLFLLLILNAKQKISITSPYFVPDEATLLAILTAASSGVEVELFVSEVADQFLVYHAQRSYYSALLAAGVSIYLYKSPTVLHSKHFTIDDEIAVVGSSNMDMRSFSLNMEVSMLVASTDFVAEMRQIENDYRNNSRPLDAKTWRARPLREKVLDGLARLTSALQ